MNNYKHKTLTHNKNNQIITVSSTKISNRPGIHYAYYVKKARRGMKMDTVYTVPQTWFKKEKNKY